MPEEETGEEEHRFEDQFRDMTDEEYEQAFGAGQDDLDAFEPGHDHQAPDGPMDEDMIGQTHRPADAR